MPPRRTVDPNPEMVVVFVGTAADEREQEAAARAVVSVLVAVEQQPERDHEASVGETG